MVDLHIHSTASDGTQTPQTIVREAEAKRLRVIALTDHDSVEGYGPAAAAATTVEVLPGVEISALVGERELHMLGYFVDVHEERLVEALRRARESRVDRAKQIVRRLQALGLRLGVADVEAAADGGAVGRAHVAAALVARGIVRDPQEAFHRYLRRGRPGFVERAKLSPQNVIQLIQDAGGVAVLAHPGLAGYDDGIPHLVEAGLGGLEVYHVDHSPAQVDRYLQTARSLGLLVTGGTDSHGPGGSSPVEIGQVKVPDECAEGLRRWGRTHGRCP